MPYFRHPHQDLQAQRLSRQLKNILRQYKQTRDRNLALETARQTFATHFTLLLRHARQLVKKDLRNPKPLDAPDVEGLKVHVEHAVADFSKILDDVA